jgi:hypothetical protein
MIGRIRQAEQGIRDEVEALSASDEQHDGTQSGYGSAGRLAGRNGRLGFNGFERCQA